MAYAYHVPCTWNTTYNVPVSSAVRATCSHILYVLYQVQSNTEATPHIHWFAYRAAQSRKSRTLESIEFAAKDDAKVHSVFAHTRRVTGKTSLTVDTAIDADAKYR